MNTTPSIRTLRLCFAAVAFFVSLAFSGKTAPADDATDVTSVVTKAIKNNKLSIQASNQSFGDTAPGIPKKLMVEYRIGDKELRREVNENGTIEIDVPAGEKLVIVKAIYGPADGSKPISLENAQELLETLPVSRSSTF